jgi:threonine 3-dehydrogenase
VITDVNPLRLKLAAEVARVTPVDVSREKLADVMSRLGMKEGFDIGLEMSGAPQAFDEMVEHMVVGGNIAMLGIPSRPAPVDWTRIVFKLLTIKGIYGREMFETWHKMIAMLQSGLDVRKVITHRLPVRNFRDGFETMRAGQSGKIVLDWSEA